MRVCRRPVLVLTVLAISVAYAGAIDQWVVTPRQRRSENPLQRDVIKPLPNHDPPHSCIQVRRYFLEVTFGRKAVAASHLPWRWLLTRVSFRFSKTPSEEYPENNRPCHNQNSSIPTVATVMAWGFSGKVIMNNLPQTVQTHSRLSLEAGGR